MKSKSRQLSTWLSTACDTPNSVPQPPEAPLSTATETTETMSLQLCRYLHFQEISPEKKNLMEGIDSEDDDSEYENAIQQSTKKRRKRKQKATRKYKTKSIKNICTKAQLTMQAFCSPAAKVGNKPWEISDSESTNDNKSSALYCNQVDSTKLDIPFTSDSGIIQMKSKHDDLHCELKMLQDKENVKVDINSPENAVSLMNTFTDLDTKDKTTESILYDVEENFDDNSIVGETSGEIEIEQEIALNEIDSNALIKTKILKSIENDEIPNENDNIPGRTLSDHETQGRKEPLEVMTMSSGRPKRQAVLNAERRKSLETQATDPLSHHIDKNPTNASKRESFDVIFISPPSSGRKRKLSNQKVGKSSSKKQKGTATTFFLSEEEKKNIKEAEAIAAFKEQLRRDREKDLEFFGGKTCNDATSFFFQKHPQGKSQNSGDDKFVDLTSPVATLKKSTSISTANSCTKVPLFNHFPSFQLVTKADCPDVNLASNKQWPKKKRTPTDSCIIIPSQDLIDLDIPVQSNVVEQACCDRFWLNSNCSSELIGLENEELIEKIVLNWNIQDEIVRSLYQELWQLHQKRIVQPNFSNLSFVDRYAPLTARGFAGNHDTLCVLTSWLSAWKVGVDECDRQSCFAAELLSSRKESYDSDSDEDLAELFRLFLLQGDCGTGKSSSVYACAAELGYNVIEINAAQHRSGKQITSIVGEATQSMRILHEKRKADKKRRRQGKKIKRKIENHATPAHLSLVLFEDIDVLFTEDKGFLTSICSIAKSAKCPIVATCSNIPDDLPSLPSRLHRKLDRPKKSEFCTYVTLVAVLEKIPISFNEIEKLAIFSNCDIRMALHHLQANASTYNTKPSYNLLWREEDLKSHGNLVNRNLPMWMSWEERQLDVLSSSLLYHVGQDYGNEDSNTSIERKKENLEIMDSLTSVVDCVSLLDLYSEHSLATLDNHDNFALEEEKQRYISDVRQVALSTYSTYQMKVLCSSNNPSLCKNYIERTLTYAKALELRANQQNALAMLSKNVNLPVAVKEDLPAFVMDYMPMMGRMLQANGIQMQHSTGRRRQSRRYHYLRQIVDVSLIDSIHHRNCYRTIEPYKDEIVDSSQSPPSSIV